MTPDSMVADTTNLQDWNAYSYVSNNPLSFTDPTGHLKLKDVLSIAVVIAVAIIAPELLPGLSKMASAVLAGAITGAVNTAINGGDIFSNILVGAFQAGMFYGAGNFLDSFPMLLGTPEITTFVVHGFVGGVVSGLQGGKFGSGFLVRG